MPQEEIVWQRARMCDSGQCVEIARAGTAYLMRRSTDPEGPVLRFSAVEWLAFAGAVRAGEFG